MKVLFKAETNIPSAFTDRFNIMMEIFDGYEDVAKKFVKEFDADVFSQFVAEGMASIQDFQFDDFQTFCSKNGKFVMVLLYLLKEIVDSSWFSFKNVWLTEKFKECYVDELKASKINLYKKINGFKSVYIFDELIFLMNYLDNIKLEKQEKTINPDDENKILEYRRASLDLISFMKFKKPKELLNKGNLLYCLNRKRFILNVIPALYEYGLEWLETNKYKFSDKCSFESFTQLDAKTQKELTLYPGLKMMKDLFIDNEFIKNDNFLNKHCFENNCNYDKLIMEFYDVANGARKRFIDKNVD
ncbi:hypothetical protein [Mycoplasma sp. E35C]|uniref:hypothetical protein n=1 Tax=Mycoplasma sp. E35C TaxID=2801918 RepID=UPI001CA3A132|nr:hypothetical protein [Mycoplasma sp. E35C]QZX49477.1 hypothetical protein JJE79_01890 [Mycoplasma sp. E35C]